jgi:surfeit locus 1 family protein
MTRRAVAGGAALALTICFVGLGLWQLQRRAWKHDLVARVEARVTAPPVPVPARAEWATFSSAGEAYRRVVVEGRLLWNRQTLVRATTALGSGYWVMTPMQTSEGTVLINRGFVPPTLRQAVMRDDPHDDGSVQLIGLLRPSEPGGGFLRSNDAANDRWYSRDVAAIAGRHHLNDVAPFFIDAEARPGAAGDPVGGLTVISFTDNHMVYALTWFALALLSARACFMFLSAGRE